MRDAVGRGVLSLEEFETRLDKVYAAKSIAELEQLVRWVSPPPVAAVDPSRQRRRGLRVGAALVVVAAIVAAVLVLRGGSSSADLPLVTRVGKSQPFGQSADLNVVYLQWPKNARDGYVENGDGGAMTTGIVKQATDYAGHNYPMSYRAVACSTRCRFGDPTGDLSFGPWYRPNVGGALDAKPPSVEVRPGPTPDSDALTIRLGAHAAAPVIGIFRDGKVLGFVEPAQTPPAGRGAIQYIAEAGGSAPRRPGGASKYSVAACYSDCSPVAMDNGFAQMTSKSAEVPASS